MTLATVEPAFAADRGQIVGTVDRAEQVKSVVAVHRDSNNKKFVGKCDATTGRFTIDGLPVGTEYDVIIDFATARLEGVSFKVPRSDYEEEQPLSDEDIKVIKTKTLELNKFENEVDVLTIEGNIQHGAILLNKRRTTPFYESKPGEIVWRAELWHFERPDETWLKRQDEQFILLYRERLQASEYAKKSLTFDPSLGGVALTNEVPKADVGRIKLPDSKAGVRLRDGRQKPAELPEKVSSP
ncbi:MAG: hypothetical protein HZA46_23845 [Planctomycetales bacterium]|nr:hypothetical protein [Planctomycetales bacterium]